MKKIMVTAAALSMIAGAANATGTAYTDAVSAYDGVVGTGGAYDVYGANMSTGTQGAWNTFLGQASDIFTPGSVTTRTIMVGGVPVTITEVGASSGTHSVNTIVGSAVAASEATAHDFVGSGSTLDATSHVGQSVAAITAAATTYTGVLSDDATGSAEASAALTVFNGVYNAEIGKINATATSLNNLSATFASANLSRNMIETQFQVAQNDATFVGPVQPTVGLTYNSRLDRLAGNYATTTVDASSFPALADVTIPAHWRVYSFDAATGVLVLDSGPDNTAADITINVTGATAAEKSGSIKTAIGLLAGRS